MCNSQIEVTRDIFCRMVAGYAYAGERKKEPALLLPLKDFLHMLDLFSGAPRRWLLCNARRVREALGQRSLPHLAAR